LKLQALEQHIYNISYCNAEETIGRSALPRPTRGRSSGGAHTSVEEPTCRWSLCWWMSPCAGGGACAPVEPAHRWSHALVEEPTHWRTVLRRDGRGRVSGGSRVGRSRGGCGRAPAAIVESWDQAGPQGGLVHGDGVGRRRWRGWPAGAPFSRATDVEASVPSPVTVSWTARRCAVLRRDKRGSVSDESWAGRSLGGWGAPADDVASGGLVEP
jgi:hypothetical protein